MKCYVSLFILIALSIVSPVLANDRTAFEQILRHAYDLEPQIRAKRFELGAERENIIQAWAEYLPKVQGIAKYGDFQYHDPLQRDGTQKTVGVEASQLIYDFGRVGGSVRQARAMVKKAEWELEGVSQDVLLQTVNAYLKYHETCDVVKLLKQHEANIQEQFVVMQEEVEEGLNRVTNLHLIESRYHLASARRIRAEGQLEKNQISLERLTGSLPVELLNAPLVDFDKHFNLPASLNEALDQSLFGYPHMQAAKSRLDASRAVYKQKRAELLPSISLKGSLQSGDFGVANSDAASAQIVLNVPIFQGGSNWSEKREAQQIVMSQEYLLTATEQRLREEVKTTWSELYSLNRVEKIWKNALEIELKSIKGIEEQALYEIVSLRELLLAQEDALQKEIEFTGILYQKLTVCFKLIQLVDGKIFHKFYE